MFINPFPNDIILGSPKLKEFADEQFKFDTNSEKFLKRVENAVRKGENGSSGTISPIPSVSSSYHFKFDGNGEKFSNRV